MIKKIKTIWPEKIHHHKPPEFDDQSCPAVEKLLTDRKKKTHKTTIKLIHSSVVTVNGVQLMLMLFSGH